MAHRPRSQTESETCFSKRKGKKRQQYIKCFFFNETNPKDVQSGSSCAVHKHGENKQTKQQSSGQGVNPRPGWTCHQGGFSWSAWEQGPQGLARVRQARASLRSAPGWLASLCPHFHECHLLPSDRRSLQRFLLRSSFSGVQKTPDLPCPH